MSSGNEDMDLLQLTPRFSFAASGSLIQTRSTAVLAGHRSYEQPTRPHISAACATNWGFNQTCWSRFPPMPGCLGAGCDNIPEGYENLPPQQLLYTLQNSLVLPDPHLISPVDGNSQAPISVFPNSAPQSGFGGVPTKSSIDCPTRFRINIDTFRQCALWQPETIRVASSRELPDDPR